MNALKVGLRHGAVWVLLSLPLAAQAALYLDGPADWYKGQPVVFEVKANSDTLLDAYQFVTDFDALVGVYAVDAVPGSDGPIISTPLGDLLELTNDPNATLLAVLPEAICNPDAPACTFFSSSSPVAIAKDTVVTRWEFLVKEDSPVWPALTGSGQSIGIVLGLPPGDPFDENEKDDPISGVSYFDLGAWAQQQPVPAFLPVPWSGGTEFQVHAVPESSSWMFMLAGLALVGIGACRRRTSA